MLTIIFVSAFLLFIIAYRYYGHFLCRKFELDDTKPTPSHTDYDGIDRVPANRAILLGHHFSSIAGAGPIVGPIIAGIAFGWLPALLWVVLGSIFIGGVHDFSSLVASIRHKARSVAEIAREYMSTFAYKLFLAFIWLTLVYILTVFIDLTSGTFVKDGGVATSSTIYILLAILFGVSVYKFKMSVLWASIIFVPLVFISIWIGQKLPITADMIPQIISTKPAQNINIFLAIYCFFASILPVWFLLQPRDYLSSYLLYSCVLGGVLGILIGGFAIHYPMAQNFWYAPQIGSLFPILFITVACGACSGFHALVGSGTSSKQLDKESDARVVAYGGMLIEGIVAVIALSTVIMLPQSDPLIKAEPVSIYSNGMSNFLSALGISPTLGKSFALLALSTFILTTLDTATRLGRYIFEEFFNLKGSLYRYVGTLATLLLPIIFVSMTLNNAKGVVVPAWKIIWPLFGATNQLMAGLTMLVISVWLIKSGKRALFLLIPMFFMVAMTIWSLFLSLREHKTSVLGIIASVLLILAVCLIVEACRILWRTYNEST